MIVVTAPTSSIGRQLIPHLLEHGEAVRVIAREPARLAPEVADRVEVVRGSHGEAAVVEKAFAGADAVFWLPPSNPHAASLEAVYQEFCRPACAMLAGQGVSHVVGLSALGRGFPGQAGNISASLEMDDMFAATGVSYRALTMPSFMDNLLRQAASIRDEGVFYGPTPADLKAPTCARRDIAAAGARLLIDRSWSGVGSVPVLGPEDLSFDDMARILSEVLGKPVRYQEVPLEGFRASLLGGGVSEAMAQGMIDMAVAKNNGLDNAEPRTVEATTPTSFRQWCEEELKPEVQA